MGGRSFLFGTTGNSGNPLAQALSLLVFALVLVGAVVMGAFVLAAVIGLAVIGFAVLAVRGWWLRRGPRGPGPQGGGGGPGRPAKGIRYIEGEYEVIDAEADTEGRRPGERR
jgi:hypothetical protein